MCVGSASTSNKKLEEESESKASRMMSEDIQHFIKNAPHFLRPSRANLF